MIGVAITVPIMAYATVKQGGHKGIRYQLPEKKGGH